MSDFIPFSSLPEHKQARVWALADALCMGDAIPLIKYFGINAQGVYTALAGFTTQRPTLISEYWAILQKAAFFRTFVMEGRT